jgi:hypothetical protein
VRYLLLIKPLVLVVAVTYAAIVSAQRGQFVFMAGCLAVLALVGWWTLEAIISYRS